jgi:hypothetical protein
VDEQLIVFVAHEDPVGRTRNSYMVRVDLAPYGLDGQVEQLWPRIFDGGGYEVACIPFCVFGLAYRDRVVLDPTGHYVGEVIAPSGHRVLRALLVGGSAEHEVGARRERLERTIAGLGLLREWHGSRHIAVDVPVGADVAPLELLLAEEAEAGALYYEWGDRRDFVPPAGHAADRWG